MWSIVYLLLSVLPLLTDWKIITRTYRKLISSHEGQIQVVYFLSLSGYIAWHGRYSAYDYASFAAFMRHTFSEVQGVGCPVFQCDSCKNDMTIDDEALGKFIHVN